MEEFVRQDWERLQDIGREILVTLLILLLFLAVVVEVGFEGIWLNLGCTTHCEYCN